MPLANRRTLDPASQTSNHQGAATLNRPGPVPCQWRNAGPMLLADDTPCGAPSAVSIQIVSARLMAIRPDHHVLVIG
jgi:hypothetical protein